jgi:hypothetical protein
MTKSLSVRTAMNLKSSRAGTPCNAFPSLGHLQIAVAPPGARRHLPDSDFAEAAAGLPFHLGHACFIHSAAFGSRAALLKKTDASSRGDSLRQVLNDWRSYLSMPTQDAIANIRAGLR